MRLFEIKKLLQGNENNRLSKETVHSRVKNAASYVTDRVNQMH